MSNLDMLMLLGMRICPSFSSFPTLNQGVCLVTQLPARFERIFFSLVTNKSEYAGNFLSRHCNQNARTAIQCPTSQKSFNKMHLKLIVMPEKVSLESSGSRLERWTFSRRPTERSSAGSKCIQSLWRYQCPTTCLDHNVMCSDITQTSVSQTWTSEMIDLISQT